MLNEQFQRNIRKVNYETNNAGLIGRTKMDEVWLEKMAPSASSMLHSVRTPEPMRKFTSHTKNSSQGLPAFTRNFLRI